MASGRILHSGNLVRGFHDTKEGDLKPLTEEEIVWLEEHFMDYLVR